MGWRTTEETCNRQDLRKMIEVRGMGAQVLVGHTCLSVHWITGKSMCIIELEKNFVYHCCML